MPAPIILSPWVRALIYFGVPVLTDLAWQVYDGLTRSSEEPNVELRRAQLVFEYVSGPNAEEDSRVCTFDFLNVTADSPDTTWTEADYQNAEARLLTFWNGIKVNYHTDISLKEIRWYAIGPGIVHSGPPRRILPVALPGTGSGAFQQLPPQVAVTLTERTQSPKNWGRVYLPAPNHATLGSGRFVTAFTGTVTAAASDLYTSFGAEEIIPVVYSKAKPARQTKAGDTLPALPARVFTPSAIVCDSIPDVIRSRRFTQGITRSILPAP